MVLAQRAMEMQHDTDPKKDIWDAVTPYLDKIEINGKDLLVIAYERPEKMKSGLALPASYRKEDSIQGIVGMVVKMGPHVAENVARFAGSPPMLGSWIVLNTGETMRFLLGEKTARLVPVDLVRAIVTAPDIVY